MYYGKDRQLHLVHPTEKDLKLLSEKEYNFNPFLFMDGYVSKEFNVMAISSFMIIPIDEEITINIVNPDNWSEEVEYNIKKLGNKIISGKDMALVYISTDALPGYKIIPNKIEFSKYEGDLIYSKDYGILFVHVIEE